MPKSKILLFVSRRRDGRAAEKQKATED